MCSDMYQMWQIKRKLRHDAFTLIASTIAQPVAPTFVVTKHQLARDLAGRIERSVRYSSIHLNCMCRSLYGLTVVRSAGLEVELCIGVAQQRRTECTAPTLKAHAWLTFPDGTIINDLPDTVSQYQPFTQGLYTVFVFD